jgi:hypothetical protein
VPRSYVEGDYNLGQWVKHQRALREKMIVERQKKLDELDLFEVRLGSLIATMITATATNTSAGAPPWRAKGHLTTE